MRLRALTHICYVRASHLDAQLDSLQKNKTRARTTCQPIEERQSHLYYDSRAFRYEH
jgi:hypothetical protein